MNQQEALDGLYDYIKENHPLYTYFEQLVVAVENHRSQKADDRCIEDDDRLYAALGDGIKCDRRVGSQCEMLENCKRFIANRTEGGTWKTYAELERENAELKKQVDELKNHR